MRGSQNFSEARGSNDPLLNKLMDEDLKSCKSIWAWIALASIRYGMMREEAEAYWHEYWYDVDFNIREAQSTGN